MKPLQEQSDATVSFIPPGWENLPDLGLYMDQVVTYLEQTCRSYFVDGRVFITPSMINNYVKSGVISRPTGKKYNRELLAQLIMLCILKPASSLDELRLLLKPESNQTIQQLYLDFCATQEKVFAETFKRLPHMTAFQLALEASICTILCSDALKKAQ
ncbi:MAG: DUF1836 domain-containing protein [Eubacteriales bacterium]|nr:DUF1836 domain-containing protein [Eubacteriales bacterium]